MTRRTLLVVSLILPVLIAIAPQAIAQLRTANVSERPALKAAATVTGDIVRIGDLVENAGAVAEVPIFRAPDLGQTGNVSVGSVLDAVQGHHLVGLDSRGLSQIAVTHAARVITAKDVEARILAVFAGKDGLPDASNLAVIFDNEVRTFEVEATATSELSAARLSYEPRTGRFDVTFELPGSAVARRLPLRFTGSLSETFQAVVPAHEIAQGQVLRASDLTLVRQPKAALNSTTLTSMEQAQGLSAKHSLLGGQILRQADLAKPELVARGESVTIVFQVPGILLTIIGKATEPGTLGDVISVLNVQTNHTVQATVIGPGRVSVGPTSERLAANATP